MFPILLLLTLLGLGWGVLSFMAGAMSDAPAEADAMGNSGALTATISLVLLIILVVAKCTGKIN